MKLFRRGLRDVGAYGFKLPVVHVVLCQPLYLGTGPPYHKTQKKFPGPGKFFFWKLVRGGLGDVGAHGFELPVADVVSFQPLYLGTGPPQPKNTKESFFCRATPRPGEFNSVDCGLAASNSIACRATWPDGSANRLSR